MAPPTANATNAYQIVISATDRASGIVAGVTGSLAQIGKTIGGSVRPAFVSLTGTVLGFFEAARSGFSDLITLIERTDSLLQRFAGTTLKDAITGFAQSIVNDISNATQYSLTEILRQVGSAGALSLGLDFTPPDFSGVDVELDLLALKVKEFSGQAQVEFDLLAAKLETNLISTGDDLAQEFETAKDRIQSIADGFGLEATEELEQIASQLQGLAASKGIQVDLDPVPVQRRIAAIREEILSLNGINLQVDLEQDSFAAIARQVDEIAQAAARAGSLGIALNVDTRTLRAAAIDLESLSIRLDTLAGQGVVLNVTDGDLTNALIQLEQLQQEVAGLEEGASVRLNVTSIATAQRQLEELAIDLAGLQELGVVLPATIDPDSIAGQSRELSEAVARLSGQGVGIELSLDNIQSVDRQLAELEAQLVDLSGQGVDLSVGIENLSASRSQIEILQQQITDLAGQGVEIELSVDRVGVARQELAQVEALLSDLELQGVTLPIDSEELAAAARQIQFVSERVAALEEVGVAVELDAGAIAGATQRVIELGDRLVQLEGAGIELDIESADVEFIREQVGALSEEVQSLGSAGVAIAVSATDVGFAKQSVEELRELVTALESSGATIDLDSVAIQETAAQLSALQGEIEALEARGVDVDLNPTAAAFRSAAEEVKALSEEARAFVEETLGQVPQEVQRSLTSAVAFAVNGLDRAFLTLQSRIDTILGQIQGTGDALSTGLLSVSGAQEAIGLFEGLQNAISPTLDSIAQVGLQITYFSSVLDALQPIVASGPYQLLINQNVQLQEQLLATQSTLAATNQVLQGGQVIGDPTAAIQSLEGPVNAAIDRIRKGSLELVGVTSSQLIESFQIIAGEAAGIGINLTEASDLTLSFAAALGTLGIPLFQARQEIGSILQGQIDQNSVLAQSLNLTNTQVAQYREQGRLFEFLTGRLEAFRAGNELAAKSLGGVTSNIQEIFENVGLAAGATILEPLVEEVTGVYDLLQTNQATITTFVTGIAESLFDALLNLSEGIGDLFNASKATLINTATVLFNALTGAINALGNALSIAANTLEPFFAILGGLSGFANLLNPLFQLGVTVKVLTATIGGLSGAFGQLARGLPFVGELLFLMEVRSSGLIGLLTGLGGAAGTGAAGFLTLGANLGKVPFLFDAIASRIPIFGSQIAALIPALSTGGIAVLGLVQRFPLLGQALQTFQGQIPQATAAIVEFAKGNAALAPYAPLLEDLAGKITQYSDATNITALANQKFAEVAKSVRQELIATGVRITAIVGGVFVAAIAFNEFVLKNEELVSLLKEVGAGLASIGELVADVLTDPILLATTAAAGLTAGLILMRTQLAALLQLQLGQFALSAAGGLGQIATVLKGLQLTTLAGGAQQAALGLQALSIAFTAGTKEARAFLVASNIQAVSLKSLGASLTGAVVGLRAFIVAQSTAAIAMIKQLPVAITTAITGLSSLNATTGAGILGFLGLGTSSGAAAAGLASAGAAAGGAAAGFGTLAASIAATVGGLAVLVAPIAAVVAAIGAIGLGLRAVQLNKSRREVEEVGKQSEAAATQTLSLAAQLKTAQERQNDADEKGIALSKEAYQENQQLQQQAIEQIALVDRQIQAVERAQKGARGEANKNALQAQIDELNRLKETLNALSGDIQIEPKDLPRLGTLLEQLTNKANEARSAIDNSAGNPEVFNRQAQALLDFNQQLLEFGAIDGEQARDEFNLIATSANADIETITSALQAVTASFELESKQQVSIVQTRQAQVEEQVLEGVITESEGQQQITEIQREQLQIQLDNLRAAKDEEIRILQQNRDNTLDELNRQLSEAQAKLDAALGDPTAAQKAADEAIAGFEAQRRTLLIQLETAQQEVEAIQASGRGRGQSGARELRQAKQSADELQQQLDSLNTQIADTRSNAETVKPDPAAAEAARADIAAINEQISRANATTNNAIAQSNREFAQAEAENQRDDAKLIAEARQQEIDRAQSRALEAAKAAETERLIELQRLENAGAVSQDEVEAARLGATQERIQSEIAAEQAKLASLLENEKANASKIRETRQRISDLTLQSLETEERAYEAHLDRIRGAIRQQQLDVEIGIQEGLNQGVVSQAQAEEARANLTIQRLQQEIALETRSNEKRKELQLQLLQAEQKAQDAREALVREGVERQQTQAQIALQRSINAGLVQAEEAEEARLQLAVQRLEQEIALETRNAAKREALTLQLLETEQRLRDAQIQTIEAKLQQAAQAYQNRLEQQNQALSQQQALYDALGRSLESQNRLLEAARDLQSAGADFVASSLGAVSELERSDFRRRQLAQITAAIQLEALQQRQALELQLFNIQQEQNRLALERREIENQIAIIRQQAAIAQGEADIRAAEARRQAGQITQEEFDAVVLKQQANLAELGALVRESQFIGRERQIQGTLDDAQRQQIELQQRSQRQQALGSLVQTLPPGLQQRAGRQLQEQIIADLTGGLAQGGRQFREQGTAIVRQIIEQELFGRGQGGNLLNGLIQTNDSNVQALTNAAQSQQQETPIPALPPELNETLAALNRSLSLAPPENLQSFASSLDAVQAQAAARSAEQRFPVEVPAIAIPSQIEIPPLVLPSTDAATRPTIPIAPAPQAAIAPTPPVPPTFTPDQLQQISDAIWDGRRGFEQQSTSAPSPQVSVQAPITVNVTESTTSDQVLTQLERVVDRAERLATSSR